jgi:GTPase involved in cell partitioning and DNA repair
MFLRHLRRTRLLLQVIDASAADPGTDYLAVREELRMYNPDYVTRPHVVALNKVDLEDAGECARGQLVSAHKVGMGAACERRLLGGWRAARPATGMCA